MRYKNFDNKRIVRLTTWMVASMVVISAIVTGAWWRDQVESGQNLYASMYGTSRQGAYNPTTSPQGDNFVIHPTETNNPLSNYITNGVVAQNAQELTLTTKAVATPTMAPEQAQQYLYIQTIQKTVDNIRGPEYETSSYDLTSPMFNPTTTSRVDALLSTYTGALATNRRVIIQGSYQPGTNQSSLRISSQNSVNSSQNAYASVLPNYTARYQQQAAGAYTSTFATIASAMAMDEGPAAGAERRTLTNDAGFFQTPTVAPLSLGWDAILLLTILAIGYGFVRSKRLKAGQSPKGE